MLMLADAGALFIGQGVAFDGVATYKDLDGVPDAQRLEWPVAEELQLGACVGLALTGQLTVSIFPRLDFLMRAMDQLVNHLDKIEQMSQGQWRPKVIIRARVGTKKPLDPGPQHSQNHAAALRLMLANVNIYEITEPQFIMTSYKAALVEDKSSLVIENLC